MTREPVLHRILGMTRDEWEDALHRDRIEGGDGIGVSRDPRHHSHPALGIIGHGHGTDEEARTPHVHAVETAWGDTIPLHPEED
jgi:hypothetical protein